MTSDGLTLRVSDAERAGAAGVLDAAVADGRLTWAEHGERSELVWAARTRAELVPPLADLGPATPAQPTQHVLARFSKVVRAVSPTTQHVSARAVFGAIVFDLSAMRPGQVLTIEASSFCGKVLLLVPPDATVLDQGEVLLGKRAMLRSAPVPGGPVVRLTGRSTLGNLKVH
ncbi:MAG: DUF1707 domain-containing protein [Labedaea sp.]